MIYLDTSALVKLYLMEEGSEGIQKLIAAQAGPLPVWELQEAELINALQLNVYWKKISLSQAKDQINFFHDRQKRGQYFFPEIHRGDLMKTFRQLSNETPQTGCRTMDIFHVACALQIESTLFVTFDVKQKSLAERVKLKTWKAN